MPRKHILTRSGDALDRDVTPKKTKKNEIHNRVKQVIDDELSETSDEDEEVIIEKVNDHDDRRDKTKFKIPPGTIGDVIQEVSTLGDVSGFLEKDKMKELIIKVTDDVIGKLEQSGLVLNQVKGDGINSIESLGVVAKMAPELNHLVKDALRKFVADKIFPKCKFLYDKKKQEAVVHMAVENKYMVLPSGYSIIQMGGMYRQVVRNYMDSCRANVQAGARKRFLSKLMCGIHISP